MKNNFLAVTAVFGLLGLGASPAAGHPGSGIVIDAEGRVYFSGAGDIDAHLPGAIWQIDRLGKRTQVHEGGAHFLALDGKRSFAQADLTRWFAQRLTPWLQRVDIVNGSLLQADGQPIVMHRDGSLYYAKRNIELVRLTADGRMNPVAPALDAEKRGGIKGLAFGPEDILYVACSSAVLKVSTNGTVTPLIASIVIPDSDLELPPNTPESESSFLRGLAVDARGTVYAASTGCRALVRITPAGQLSVVARAERPWSPTGVAVSGGEVYMLEYQHPHSTKREEWVPRVRKIASDGKVTTLATLPTAQGRP